MKAVIMAGGFGTRLRPLTNNVPKPMIPMVNKPMMEHIVDLLARHGINNTDQCAEGIALSDEYRIAEKSPEPWSGTPDEYFVLPGDGHFLLLYEAGNFQLYEHD